MNKHDRTAVCSRTFLAALILLASAGALLGECGKYYCDYFGSLGPSSFRMPCSRCGRAQTLGDWTFVGVVWKASDDAAGYVHTHLLQCPYCGYVLGNPIYRNTATPLPGASCFIATAAYGTPDAPNVVVLREFRDKYLLTNRYGRVLVGIYCTVSPPLAALIAKSPLARSVVRFTLRPVVGAVTPLVGAVGADAGKRKS